MEASPEAASLAKAMEAHLTKQQHTTTPRADSASSIFAIEARQAAESDSLTVSEAGGEGGGGGSDAPRGDVLGSHQGDLEADQEADLATVRGLVEEAKRRLEAQARDEVSRKTPEQTVRGHLTCHVAAPACSSQYGASAFSLMV